METTNGSNKSSAPSAPSNDDDDEPEEQQQQTVTQLRRLLHQRNQEIRALKLKLASYKLALRRSAGPCCATASEGVLFKAGQSDEADQSSDELGTSPCRRKLPADNLAAIASTNTTTTTTTTTTTNTDENDNERTTSTSSKQLLPTSSRDIHDHGDRLAQHHFHYQRHDIDHENNDEDEDIISDGLLTSLTDAAISNLSQLAALQERCESQKQHQHHPLTQQHSPVSPLHFSPSTSITPSPSSLIATHSRRSISQASSSLLSPISSPNYLRRQFMPDRVSMMSPSPTSGLVSGTSSGASSSLAHHLINHTATNQQRSASALAGSIMSSSSSVALSASVGSVSSSAISPMLGNKSGSQARLNNMQIRHKFGYLGSGRAQFNSPHGFCLGLNQEIVVADTNNHRVCIFDKSGTYITQFGSPGKEEGQLWNPRKVAILHRPTGSPTGISSNIPSTSAHQQQQQVAISSSQQNVRNSHSQQLLQTYTGNIRSENFQQQQQQVSKITNINSGSINNSVNITDNAGTSPGSLLASGEPLYVVCDRGAERSRMQLFTKDGAFIKKIGIHYIDIVAGLAITQNGLIIVVDSVSPTVYIINGETGNLNGWFDCSGHMKEPSDIAVKSDVPGNEYFICDFKGHCVVVFSEQGEYLRKIGHDGLTSYPNGIDISDDGDILVGDSHGNRFHVVVFDRNGK